MKEILDKILAFRDARDWAQFHTPRNLAISLSLEAAEVLEIFQWKLDDELSDDERTRLKEEVADVLVYLLLLTNSAQIDLAEAFEAKMKSNEAKYPVHKSKGRATKYTRLE